MEQRSNRSFSFLKPGSSTSAVGFTIVHGYCHFLIQLTPSWMSNAPLTISSVFHLLRYMVFTPSVRTVYGVFSPIETWTSEPQYATSFETNHVDFIAHTLAESLMKTLYRSSFVHKNLTACFFTNQDLKSLVNPLYFPSSTFSSTFPPASPWVQALSPLANGTSRVFKNRHWMRLVAVTAFQWELQWICSVTYTMEPSSDFDTLLAQTVLPLISRRVSADSSSSASADASSSSRLPPGCTASSAAMLVVHSSRHESSENASKLARLPKKEPPPAHTNVNARSTCMAQWLKTETDL